MASALSTSPSTANLVVSFSEDRSCSPCCPVAAISAARPMVSLNETPIALDNSLDVATTSCLIFFKSAEAVPEISP